MNDFSSIGDQALQDGLGAERIRIAEYFYIEETPGTLVRLADGHVMDEEAYKELADAHGEGAAGSFGGVNNGELDVPGAAQTTAGARRQQADVAAFRAGVSPPITPDQLQPPPAGSTQPSPQRTADPLNLNLTSGKQLLID